MSRVVWKYKLLPGVNTFDVPDGSRFVAVAPWQPGDEGPAVWIERERLGESGPRLRLVAIGTGHDIPPGAAHLGSAWCGSFMWHVYELGPA